MEDDRDIFQRGRNGRRESRFRSSNSQPYHSPSETWQKVIENNIRLPRIGSYISEMSNEDSGDDSEEEKEAADPGCASIEDHLEEKGDMEF